MPDETRALIDRVEALLGIPPGDHAAIEDVLTEGYARALALEAEHRRLERRIANLAGDAGDHIFELVELAGRRTRAEGDLFRLRDVLRALREHLAGAPAAQPAAQPSSAV